MAVIAPWLQPPDFVGAASSGYRLGLSRQEMLERADEHAAEIALQAEALRQKNSEQAANRAQDQSQFSAGQSLRQEALRQQGLLGSERIGNEQAKISSADELNQARISALQRKPVVDAINQNVRTTSLNNLTDLMAAHPEMTKPEILARFPALKGADFTIAPKAKPIAVKPLYPPGIQDQLFKQLLLNSRGGTNVDEAISGLQRYMQPATAAEAPSPEDVSAGESLNRPTAESVDGLPASPAAAPAIPTVNSQEEYDALAPGAKYLDSNGKLATKRASQ